MTFDQIQAFLLIVSKGSFKAAAQSLHISQPAVSVAIRKLEDSLGVQLFDRSQYRPQLTEAGHQLLPQAQAVHQTMQRLRKQSEQLQQGRENHLRITVGDLCPFELTLQVMQSFFKKVQDCQLVLQCEGVYGPVEKVLRREAEIGLASIPEEDLDQFESLVIFETELVPVIARSSLPQVTRDNGELDLSNHVHVVIRDTSSTGNETHLGIDKTRSLLCSVSDQYSKLRVIEAGLGWGRLPDFLVQSHFEKKELARLESPSLPTPRLQIRMFRRLNEAVGPVAQEFWEYLRQQPWDVRIVKN